MITRLAKLLGGVALFALAACQHNPQTASVAVNPQTAPTRTITSFNESLRCMDDLLLARGIRDVYVTSAGIPDATGTIAAGTKEMLITAIAMMSAKSGAFRFVDYDPTQIDVQVLSEMVGLRGDFVAPSYYVRGAITQLDSNVLSSSNAASVSLPFLDLAASKDQVVSVISVDLNMGKLVTRQILPGMSASNSIAVVRTGKGADAGGVFGKGMGRAGISFTVALDRAEGFHQAVRNLVELSTIEVLGKLTRVPYWQCLKLDSTNPTYRTEARSWFDTMSEKERVKFVKTNLVRTGYLTGTPNDQFDSQTREAISRYQSQHDLVPNGRIDFDLYYRMLAASDQERVAALPPAALPDESPATRPELAPTSIPEVPPPSVALSTNKKVYRVSEKLVVEAKPAQDGYLYCYYQDSDGQIARIFPNRFQPNALVKAGETVRIPNGSFNILFDKPRVKEAVACVTAATELGTRLPEALRAQDLEPLPVRSFEDIFASFRRLGKVNEGTLPIEVM